MNNIERSVQGNSSSLKSPTMTFFVPEGAIPTGGLTPEEQITAARHHAQLQKLFSEIAKPTTQMMHTAASLREQEDLGEKYNEERKSGILRTTTRFLGLSVAHRDKSVDYVHRVMKRTNWSVVKNGLHKTSVLEYSVYDNDLLKVDGFNLEFREGRNNDPIASLRLKYNSNQQLTDAGLTWNGDSPMAADLVAPLFGKDKTALMLIRDFCQPNNALIRGVIRAIRVWDASRFGSCEGGIHFNLGVPATMGLDSNWPEMGFSFSSQFQYNGVSDKFVRELDLVEIKAQEEFCVSTRTELPSGAILAGFNSILGVITPQIYSQG